ncbi:MAG: hypothetical protein Q7K54_03050 [Candidatus Parcubacteria bacterium]|nr:hypothetical protein [Candidatus Parcubacteria bacterium]
MVYPHRYGGYYGGWSVGGGTTFHQGGSWQDANGGWHVQGGSVTSR